MSSATPALGETRTDASSNNAGVGARSARDVKLLDRSARRARNVEADWLGFAIADRLVVGHGLDHAESYCNRADIGVLDGV